MATIREEVLKLIEAIPDDRLADAKPALERLVDPVVFALANAPYDDEEVTEEDLAALAEARDAHRRGETISHDEVMRELGL